MPTSRSVGMSRRLLITSSAHASEPTAASHHHRQRRDRLDGGVGRARRGDQPEEHEDEHLTEPEVAVRLRASGVEPAGGDRRDAHQEQHERRRQRDRQAGDRSDPERRRTLPASPPTGWRDRSPPAGSGRHARRRCPEHRRCSRWRSSRRPAATRSRRAPRTTRHHTTSAGSPTAAAAPTATGTTAAGRVRGRAPVIQRFMCAP